MPLFSRPRRPTRAGDWTRAGAVTFIVTLAATRNVTLAARAAGMSRKAAYALRDRDSRFADAWRAALAVPSARRQGDKVEEVEGPPNSPGQGNNVTRARPPAAAHDRRQEERLRDAFFARISPVRREPVDAHLLRRTNALSR